MSRLRNPNNLLFDTICQKSVDQKAYCVLNMYRVAGLQLCHDHN